MKITFRWIVYAFLTLVMVVGIGTFVAEFLIKHKVSELFEQKLPENMVGRYDDISVNIWTGSISLKRPSLIINNEENGVGHTFMDTENLKISKFDFWKYLKENEIHIGNIVLENPQTTVFNGRKTVDNDTAPEHKPTAKLPPIYIGSFKLESAELAVYENNKDSTKLNIKNLSALIEEMELSDKTFKKPVPIVYQNIAISSDSIFLRASAYENLSLENFKLTREDIVFNNINFATKYSKTELSRLIDVERDHYDLSLKSLSIHGYDFGFTKDTFYVKSNNVILTAPSLEIFRDKLVADDLSNKPLYSKSLRELPFQLTVDSLQIRNGFVQYQERVNEKNNGGSINFKDMDAVITNLGNTYAKNEKTKLEVNTIFMDNTPFSAVWRFDVQNTSDDFIFEGKVGHLEAKKMDRFTKPNLNVRLNGQAKQTFFTIDGNDNTSHTTMKISYSGFKVSVLRGDGEKKNRAMSSLVNIFVSKNSKKKGEYYREASADAKRDKTKSVFNFLWISVKSALKKNLT